MLAPLADVRVRGVPVRRDGRDEGGSIYLDRPGGSRLILDQCPQREFERVQAMLAKWLEVARAPADRALSDGVAEPEDPGIDTRGALVADAAARR